MLGQLLSAQNLLFVLPDDTRIGQFFAQALGEVPAVRSCHVCLGDPPGPGQSPECIECHKTLTAEKEGIGLPLHFMCPLVQKQGDRVIRVGTAEHTFGFFVFHIESAEVFDPYLPFLSNLAGYVGLSLETRLQRKLIEKARDDLDVRVQERTAELQAANALLAEEIHERRIAQDELHQTNERFMLAATAANLGVWDWDLQNNHLVWDDRMYSLYGIQRRDFENPYDAWLNGLHPEDHSISEHVAELASGGDRSYEAEFRILWPDGSLHYLKSYAEIVRDETGRAFRMTGVNFDVTSARVAENEIYRLNQELERRVRERTAELELANRELEAFAYSVSHDLRAPLRHIDGFVGLLAKRIGDSLDDQGRHYLDTISAAARRMGTLIDDLLSFSRMGRSELTRTDVDTLELVQSIIKDFEPEAQGRIIEWKIADLPFLWGDRAMLHVVFTNLIANALKFTRPMERAIIEIGCQSNRPPEVILFVRDNGVGFDMRYADKLFGVFQRLHSAEEFEGTGIGLANVRRVILRHGGRVWAESTPGQGSTFFLALPAGKDGEPAISQVTPPVS